MNPPGHASYLGKMWKKIRRNIKPFAYVLFFCVVCSYRVFFERRDGSAESHTLLYDDGDVENTLQNVEEAQIQKRAVTKSIRERGPSANTSDHLLMLNRIPGTGSEVFVLLLQWLQPLNGFAHERLDGQKLRGEKSIVSNVMEMAKTHAMPVTFDYSRPFINFSKYGEQSPTYFSVLRDPLTILESRYYAKILNSGHKSDIDDIQSFEDCWLSQEPECRFEDDGSYQLPMSYICGSIYNGNCSMLNSDWALSRAKEVIDRYYPVIGLLENINDTLRVLEHKLPKFFRRASDLYGKRIAGIQSRWKGASYVSGLVETEMKHIFRCEYDFYNWAKARLQNDMANLEHISKTTRNPLNYNIYDSGQIPNYLSNLGNI